MAEFTNRGGRGVGDEAFNRNRQVYEEFWAQRWRRYWTYSNQGKLRRFRRIVRRAGVLQRKGLKVFDMGFGLGSMLFAFDKSCELAGTELSLSNVEEAKKVARRKGFRYADFRVYQPGMVYPPEWRRRFDVVISSHVLEHVEEPEAALGSLLKLLRPNGYACIIVPVNEKPGDDLNHFNHFTENSICSLLMRAGLQLLHVESCDRILNIARPLIRKLQAGPSRRDKLCSIGFNLAFGFAPMWFLRLADFKLLPKHWPCCQCLILSQKPGDSVPECQ